MEQLLRKVVRGVGKSYNIDCSYKWTYAKFIIHSATGYDVLKKIQEECGADIYLKDGTLHVHPPGAVNGITTLHRMWNRRTSLTGMLLTSESGS